MAPLLQPGGVLAVTAGLIAWSRPAARWVTRRSRSRRAALLPESPRRPLRVVAADVRRLRRQIAFVPAGAPMAHRRALAAAYEAVFMATAVLLEVPNDLRTTRGGPLREAARMRLLADLEEAGLAVRA